jgi:Uma2 family endonuclease
MEVYWDARSIASRYARIVKGRCLFAPDLATEVVPPLQDADDMAAKVRTYFAGGTRLVWIIWPQSKHIDIWRQETRDRPEMTLNVGDTLEGEDVVPGFICRVVELMR